MSDSNDLSRRALFAKIGLLLNGLVATIIAVPVVGFLLSPALRDRKSPLSWVSLGTLDRFPEGQTRMATYRNPYVSAWDGETADIPCWVRHVAADKFQVFAINCAHLGCPVRWFQQSQLFMCPCHGGVYYADGARASGPPERGLFEYPYKVAGGELLVQAGELPTPGIRASLGSGKPPCA
jgi:Rieske Fe-S protein